MKMHKLILLSTLVAGYSTLSAQDYAFKVLASKGNNEIKSGETWQPLKTGASLKSGDELKLSDNAYIGLVHNTGKPVEVKQAGVHKVATLESKVGTSTSVLHKYTDFILSSNSAEAKKNRLSATGAVHRGEPVAEGAIRLHLPEKEHSGVFNKTAVINWDANDVAGPYVITIRNMFEDVLVKQETPETSYVIDLADEKFSNENAILIDVSAKSDPGSVSTRHLIKKLSPAELEKISVAIKDLQAEVGDETAMNKLFLAGFYEQHNLLIDAITAYEQAMKLEPEVPAFKDSYEEFMERNSLK
jgi:hypothetical protein